MSANLVTLPPSEYDCETLCERCGNDGTGRRFAICAEGYTHAESCATYRHRGLCVECEADLANDFPQPFGVVGKDTE